MATHVTVSEEAAAALRRAVVQRFGKMRGHLLNEASAALVERAQRLREQEEAG